MNIRVSRQTSTVEDIIWEGRWLLKILCNITNAIQAPQAVEKTSFN